MAVIGRFCNFLPNINFLPELSSPGNRNRANVATFNQFGCRAKHSSEYVTLICLWFGSVVQNGEFPFLIFQKSVSRDSILCQGANAHFSANLMIQANNWRKVRLLNFGSTGSNASARKLQFSSNQLFYKYSLIITSNKFCSWKVERKLENLRYALGPTKGQT